MNINKEYPSISIGIPTYNGQDKITTALTSVLDQGYPNLEIILSDNCSTDETNSACLEFSKKFSQIKYFRQPSNIGLLPNFEFVIRKATGDYFMWVADDDWLEPGILEKYVDFLVTHPGYALVSGQIQYWSGDEPKLREKDFNMTYNSRLMRVIWFYFNVKYGGLFHGMMKRSLALNIPLWNGIGTDWHFVAGLAFQGKVMTMNEVGYHKKLNGSSRNFKQYARVIGASWVSEQVPHLKMAFDAWIVSFRSPVYKELNMTVKFCLAAMSAAGILVNHYIREVPFIIGGKIKRTFLRFRPGTDHNLSQLKAPLIK